MKQTIGTIYTLVLLALVAVVGSTAMSFTGNSFANYIGLIAIVVTLVALIQLHNVKDKFDNVIGSEPEQLLQAITSINNGDLNLSVGNIESSNQQSIAGQIKLLKDTLNQTVSDLSTLSKQKIDLNSKTGLANKLLSPIAKFGETGSSNLENINQVLSALARGDTSQRVNQTYSGQVESLKQSINALADSLADVSNEIQTVVESANNGDLSKRVNTNNKQGFAGQLAISINNLMENSHTALQEVSNVLDALSHGDLTKKVQGNYKGTFNALKDYTNGTVDNLSRLINDIQSSAVSINSSSKEIAGSNNDLYHRTDQQTSSLRDTANNMENISHTVRQNAENAKQANQFVMSTAEVAEKGGAVVGQVVTTMNAITESSRKISDIISIIDNIAFQTNILALNAAVEAARAGEQGRGFAVVASEVRTLAQRSASAAKDIKVLITDSVTRVEQGSKFASQAGDTMQEIVESVRRVTDIVAEISAASTEQSEGIESVKASIVNMDNITKQSLSVVQHANSIAENLARQSDGLASSVTVFRIGNGSSSFGSSSVSSPLKKASTTMSSSSSSSNSNLRSQTASRPSASNATPAMNFSSTPVHSSDDWSEF